MEEERRHVRNVGVCRGQEGRCRRHVESFKGVVEKR